MKKSPLFLSSAMAMFLAASCCPPIDPVDGDEPMPVPVPAAEAGPMPVPVPDE